MNDLLEAVDSLTRDRQVVQWQEAHEHEWERCKGTHDPYGIERCADVDCLFDICVQCHARRSPDPTVENPEGRLGVHKETHPPLLVMLMNGISSQGGSPSSDPGVPIDADALEIWAQIRDLIKLWCRQLDATFTGDDLLGSIQRWHLAHTNAYRARKFSDVIDRDVTHMVEGWVRMIETKFDPPPKGDFTDYCPAYVPTRNVDGDEIGHRRCGARRILVDGDERFAIQINWKTLTAECGRCHCRWSGERGFMMLRYESNRYALERAEAEAERMAELARLAAGDTPKADTADIAS